MRVINNQHRGIDHGRGGGGLRDLGAAVAALSELVLYHVNSTRSTRVTVQCGTNFANDCLKYGMEDLELAINNTQK